MSRFDALRAAAYTRICRIPRETIRIEGPRGVPDMDESVRLTTLSHGAG